MATTTTVGHVSRALDFFDRNDVYWAIGRTTAWENDGAGNIETALAFVPPTDDAGATELEETVAYKKIEARHLVVSDAVNGTIVYRNTKWLIVPKVLKTTTNTSTASGSKTVSLTDVGQIAVGHTLSIGGIYKGKVTNIGTGNVTLDTAAPSTIASGAVVDGGAEVNGARWVYVESTLYYDEVPLEDYRQVGVFSRLNPVPGKEEHATLLPVDVQSKGILEIIDNRKVVNRQIDQSETLSVVIEF